MTWQGLILDVVAIAALTVLAALHIAPIEAVLSMISMLVGAHAMQALKNNSGGPPTSGGGAAGIAAGSTVAALVFGLGHLFRGHHA